MSDSNSSNDWDNSPSSGDSWNENSGDSVTETTHKSWFQRIMESLTAILIGLVLVVASCALMFWNEGNSARESAALSEGAGLVTTVASDRVDSANEGKLVHVAGETKAVNPARDVELGVAGNGLKLSRKVEMYQWKEERKSEKRQRLGGGEETVTTYSYQRTWSEQPISSSSFREASNHSNPEMPATRSRSFTAEGVTLGGFKLDDRILSSLRGGDSFDVPASAAARVREKFGDRAKVERGGVYVGWNANEPQVGDLRVSYTLLPIQPVSVAAKQTQGGFTPYTTSNQRTIMLAETGVQDAALLFKHAQDSNKIITWIIRAVGIFLLFIGFRMMLTLLEVLASVVPIFGDIVGFGASAIALLATAVVAPLVIAFAWFFYRPLYAALIFAAGMAIFFGLRQLAARRAGGQQGVARGGGFPGGQVPMPAGGGYMPGQTTGFAPPQNQQPQYQQPNPYQQPPQQPQPPQQGGSFLPPRQNNQNQGGGGGFLPPGFGKK